MLQGLELRGCNIKGNLGYLRVQSYLFVKIYRGV